MDLEDPEIFEKLSLHMNVVATLGGIATSMASIESEIKQALEFQTKYKEESVSRSSADLIERLLKSALDIIQIHHEIDLAASMLTKVSEITGKETVN